MAGRCGIWASRGNWACAAEGSWACAALEGSSWAGARSTHSDTGKFRALVLLYICFDAEDASDAGGRNSGSGGSLRDSGEEGGDLETDNAADLALAGGQRSLDAFWWLLRSKQERWRAG